ncbi:rho GTPase-activating protein 36 isoform X1 [Erpetoichthys calabaricus]|uniref:Rho GTPase-activating protein 6-like n=1 Tax=Erpetoichthys calabaricus TaxID=27687 RepID=A0A8C4SEP1_ERPCA|nr:rho GTPase-activating protein 36 isoform X1 [Erpetoichthys calabaricus]
MDPKPHLSSMLLRLFTIHRSIIVKKGSFSMLGQSFKFEPVFIQDLSELERDRLQEIAFFHLREKGFSNNLLISKDSPKRELNLRMRLDALYKEKKEKGYHPQVFGIPLSEVIAFDRIYKQKQDALKESRRNCLNLEASVMTFRTQKLNNFFSLSSSLNVSCYNSRGLSSLLENDVNDVKIQRRGGVSVDCLSELDDSHTRLLEALQLSHPFELESKKVTEKSKRLSLNPIFRQVPRVVDKCCRHIETCGLQTVGIFRLGSSKKRVRQLRDDFDQGKDVILDEEQSIHDVAALLKEFLRDMPDPLLPSELYSAFLSTSEIHKGEQISFLQLLIFLLPPCNCDTLYRILQFLNKVASHSEDICGPDNQEICGNKMTAANLATVFGPNLLQREKTTGKDLTPYVTEVEDSAKIILVVQILIENYDLLFTVSPELQQEVLESLIQTDPDVIQYLIRRKHKSHLLN